MEPNDFDDFGYYENDCISEMGDREAWEDAQAEMQERQDSIADEEEDDYYDGGDEWTEEDLYGQTWVED